MKPIPSPADFFGEGFEEKIVYKHPQSSSSLCAFSTKEKVQKRKVKANKQPQADFFGEGFGEGLFFF